MRVFLEKGYNHAGIEAILQEAGVPKGSFYYYFSSKEDFGVQVIDRFAECYRTEMDRHLGNTALSPLERLRSAVEAACQRLESQSCRNGCLVGNLSQEMAAQSEVFRTRLVEIFEEWVERYAECFREAQAIGEIPDHLEPRTLAEFWLSGWQGAILRAKTIRSTAPLRNLLSIVFGSILQGSVPAK